MRKLSEQERSLLRRVSAAGGSHCFNRDDPIPSSAHKALRSLERRGYLAVETTQDGIRVTVTWAAQGLDEADHG